MLFNRSHITRHGGGVEIDERDIKHSVGLLNASLGDAIRYGGDAVRGALSTLRPMGQHEHLIVDTKIHMLKKGMVPAIPGWHTDGVPRGVPGEKDELAPFGPVEPDLRRQDGQRSPLYHLLVVGCDAPTVFLEDRNVDLHSIVPCGKDLYARITDVVNRNAEDHKVTKRWQRVEIPQGEWWTFDWWELHSAQAAREDGWRMLIRVTESDYVKPERDLRKVIRTHQQAYINGSFGW